GRSRDVASSFKVSRSGLVLSPDCKTLACAQAGGRATVSFYNLATGQQLPPMIKEPFRYSTTATAYSRDSLHLAAAGDDEVYVVDLASGKQLPAWPRRLG